MAKLERFVELCHLVKPYDTILDLPFEQARHNSNHEYLVPADKAIARYREFCQDWEDRGWLIDVKKFRADYDSVAYAIPSPARSKAKGWVLPAVPTITGKKKAQIKAVAG